jgi:hypothetical protein
MQQFIPTINLMRHLTKIGWGSRNDESTMATIF